MPAFLLPDLGEGLTEAEIVTWHVQAGDTVTVDQTVVEVETAKAVVEVPVPFAGRVTALHGEPGDVLAVGAPLITVEPRIGSPSQASSRTRPDGIRPDGIRPSRAATSSSATARLRTPPPSPGHAVIGRHSGPPLPRGRYRGDERQRRSGDRGQRPVAGRLTAGQAAGRGTRALTLRPSAVPAGTG